MVEKVDTYRKLNEKYLVDAANLIEKKDYVQASEKLWGATAEALKAVAATRGRNLRTHADLWEFVRELDSERPEWRLRHKFRDADHLHSNFYEDELPGWAVEDAAEVVRDLVGKLRELL